MKLLVLLPCFLSLALADENYVKQNLVGNWKEDQYKRTGLNNFLYEMGMNWFKRVYVTNANWENVQEITFDGDRTFHVEGTKGPLATRFQFDLVSDFATRTQVDLGELGGKTLAKAKFEGNKLITHIHNKKTGVHFLTATREMDAREYHITCKYFIFGTKPITDQSQ